MTTTAVRHMRAAKKGVRQKHDDAVLELKCGGPGVRSGRIPVPDLIRICQEVQNTVNRQAEALEGRKTVHPGPVVSTIRHECTLELVAIRKGSTTLEFGLAARQKTLPLPELKPFGSEVVGQIAHTIKTLGNGNKGESIAPGVLQGLYGLGGIVDSGRVTKLSWITPKNGAKRRISAPITKVVRERVAKQLSAPRRVTASADGVLDMADFKPKERRCRIDPALGASILCSFDMDKENQIYSLLRKPVRITGTAKLQPYTDKIEIFHIQSIQELPSLELGQGIFFADKSIDELASLQDVKPLKSSAELAGFLPDEEDVDELLQEIYASRK